MAAATASVSERRGPATGRWKLGVVLLALLGIALSSAVFVMMLRAERIHLEDELALHGREIATQLEDQLARDKLIVSYFRAFFAGSEEVTRTEFREFARTVVAPSPGIRWVAWVPVVPESEVAAYEARARGEGLPDFRVRDLPRHAGGLSDPRPAERYPVYYVEPALRQGTLGLDLASNPNWVASLQRVRDSGEVLVIDARLEPDGVDGERGFIMAAPVFGPADSPDESAGPQRALMGFLLARFQMQQVLESVMRQRDARGVDVHVFDPKAAPASRLVAYHSSQHRATHISPAASLSELAGGPHAGATVRADGASWLVVATPSPIFVARQRTAQPWLGLLAGLLVTFFVTLYVASAQSATARATRTASDLFASKEALESEVRERARVEAALRDSERDYREVFNATSEAIFVHDGSTGAVHDVNATATSMYGWSREELLGTSVASLSAGAAPYARDDALRYLRRAVEEGPQLFEWRARHKDGQDFWVEVALRSTDIGGQGRVLAVVRDISERKRAEEERTHLVTAVEQAAEAILVTDRDGRIRYVNPAFEELSGYEHGQALGRDMMSLAGNGDAAGGGLHDLWETLRAGDAWTGRYVSRRPDGAARDAEATFSPVRDAAGGVTGYVSVQRDITEHLKLEARVRQGHKMEAMGTLAGGIAHDFNNILSAILGFTDLALCDAAEGDPVRASLERVADAGRRARDLVAQILAFSRQADREWKPLRLQLVAKEALELLRGSIPSTVEIRRDIDPRCPPVMADPGTFHQIIMNLCTNAYHALGGEAGVVSVALREAKVGREEASQDPHLKPGRYVRLTVSDTGHGMTPVTQGRIFEPYFTTKERGEGTGLGLSTVHGIVEDMGGAIHVYSELGVGSTFSLFFPCIASEQSAAAPGRADEREIRGDERILIVDDEEPIATFMERALGRLGYQVTTCASGPEALAVFRADPQEFDIVITDQMMPKMKGTQLSREIIALRPGIPIILCSGFGDLLEETRSESNGIISYVRKPVIAADIARAVRQAFAAPPPPVA